MTLRKKDLEAEVRAEPRVLPHKETDTGTASDRNRSDIATASKRYRKKGFLVRLSPEDHAALQRDSELRGISMGAIVRELVHKYLKRI
jgi:predicted HicB family RNase H-like nuclease